jgi:hypothetical protein
MKINEKFIEDIFNHKFKLKNKADKIKLSSFSELIPMYDIYTQKIYPIKKENTYYRLTESHYRFINNEVKNSLDTLCFKLIDEREKFSEKTLADIYDPNYMPESIKKIHLEIDGIIDEILNINSNWEDDKKIVSMLETYKKLKNIETLI